MNARSFRSALYTFYRHILPGRIVRITAAAPRDPSQEVSPELRASQTRSDIAAELGRLRQAGRTRRATPKRRTASTRR